MDSFCVLTAIHWSYLSNSRGFMVLLKVATPHAYYGLVSIIGSRNKEYGQAFAVLAGSSDEM